MRLWAQLRVAYHGVDARFRPTEAIQDHAEVVPHPEEEDIVVNRPTHHLARIEKHAFVDTHESLLSRNFRVDGMNGYLTVEIWIDFVYKNLSNLLCERFVCER